MVTIERTVTYHTVNTLTKQCTEHRTWPSGHCSSRVALQSFVKRLNSCFPAPQCMKSLLVLQFLKKKKPF